MIELRTGDRRAAFDVPFNVYEAASPYVSPMWSDFDRFLDPARNPLARDGRGAFELFTAHRDGRPVGRIVAAMHDASNRRHGTRRGQFGFFDCADDPAVADALLSAAEAWVRDARRRGDRRQLQSDRDADGRRGDRRLRERALHRHDVVAAAYRAPARRRGLRAVLSDDDIRDRPHAGRSGGPASVRSRPRSWTTARYTWRPIRRRDFKAVMEDARVVLNDGFDRNPMFVPVSAEEYAFQAGEMMWVMDPRLSVVVYHDGKPAGVIVCIPDLNPFVRACRSRLSLTAPWHFLKQRLTGDRAVIIYYSVTPSLQGARAQRRHAEPAGRRGEIGRLPAARHDLDRRRQPGEPAPDAAARREAAASAASLRQAARRRHVIDLALLKAALDEARLAPSVHNVQPTRWRLAGDRLLLLGDPARTIPVADPAGRDWRLSHGAHFEGLVAGARGARRTAGGAGNARRHAARAWARSDRGVPRERGAGRTAAGAGADSHELARRIQTDRLRDTKLRLRCSPRNAATARS